MLRPRAEDGFTLLELLAAMVIGMVVLFGAFTVIDGAFRVNADVSGRSEATERGRAAMDDITRALRSQVCATGTSRVLSAGPTQVTFTTDLSDGARLPEKRQISDDPAAHTITQSVWDGQSGSPPNIVFKATAKTTVLVTDTDADPATTPAGAVFAYWAVTPNTDGTSFTSLGSTVAAADLDRVARIDVAFVTRPNRAKAGDDRAVSVSDSVLVRALFANDNDQRYSCQ
jgi:prepilin-type N-terminal cleavage/methylation domain-containing protein